MFDKIKDWTVERWEERTTWDGAVLIVVGCLVLFFGSLVKWATIAAIVYGIWTLVKPEW